MGISRLEFPQNARSDDAAMQIMYYVLEMEAQTQYYEQLYQHHPQVHWHNFRVEQLADVDQMRELTVQMDLIWKSDTDLQAPSCSYIAGATADLNHFAQTKSESQEKFRQAFTAFTSGNVYMPAHTGMVPLPPFSARASRACGYDS